MPSIQGANLTESWMTAATLTRSIITYRYLKSIFISVWQFPLFFMQSAIFKLLNGITQQNRQHNNAFCQVLFESFQLAACFSKLFNLSGAAQVVPGW